MSKAKEYEERLRTLIQFGQPHEVEGKAITILKEAREAYHQSRLKEVSDDDILRGASQQDSMEEALAWGDGAKWLLNKLKTEQ